MKLYLLLALIYLFQLTLISQDLYDYQCIIDTEVVEESEFYINPINLTGHFEDLVIIVGFPDRPNTQALAYINYK